MSSVESIRALAESALAASGLQLWDVELDRGVVRVMVDRPGGVDLEALTAASGALSALLDDHPEAVSGSAYELEVSSPGIERTLRTPEQYRRYLDCLVSVKTSIAVHGSRRWRGTLVSVTEDGVEVVAEDGGNGGDALSFRFEQIERTRTVLIWGPAPAPGARPRRTKQTGGSPRRTDPRTGPAATGGVLSGADVKDKP